jgi:2-phosphosulfolactate phosphatase
VRIDVTFLPAELKDKDLSNTVCIVLDIFRATTSIVTAMANGCETIIPVESTDAARNLAQRERACLLAGERRSLKIDGFDLGNSPFDFSADIVKNRSIIMTTTNGTLAIKATEGACQTLIGSFLNAEQVCRTAKQSGLDILIVCAGTERLFSLEDGLCAGLMVDILHGGTAELTDSAYAASLMYSQARDMLLPVAKNSRNGQRLCELRRENEVEYCLQVNIFDTVPEYRNGTITKV